MEYVLGCVVEVKVLGVYLIGCLFVGIVCIGEWIWFFFLVVIFRVFV